MMTKFRTTLALALLVLGMLAMNPESARAGDPGSQNGNVANAFQYCLKETGDQTYYRCRPRSCQQELNRPKGSGCASSGASAAGLAAAHGKGSGFRSGHKRRGVEPDAELWDRLAATMLSTVLLVGGLAIVILLIRRSLKRALAYPATPRLDSWKLPLYQRAVGFAAAIVLICLASGAWLSTRSTDASVVAQVSKSRTSRPQAQALATGEPRFSSAFEFGGTGTTQVGGTAIDPQGNIYVAGGFAGAITFNTPSQPTTLTSSDSFDVFIAKFNAAGEPLWARMANGSTDLTFTDPDSNQPENFSLDGALSLAVDAQGNAYVGGGFVKSLAFKNASGNTVATLGDDAEAESDEINFELFVAKYDAGGTLQWARGGESGTLDDAESEEDLDSGINGITEIVLDSNGNPFVGGTFSGTEFLGQTVSGEGGRDVLLARLSPVNGDPLWVSTPGSANTDAILGMDSDAAGNIYIIGDIGGTITFPTEPQPTTFQLEDGFGDAFIAKYDQSGQVLYAKQIGGTQPIDGMHIAVNSAGELYLTGAFEGTAKFDSITVADQSDGSGASGFLTKYGADGSAVWVRTFGRSPGEASDGDVIGYRVSVDASGSPFVTGIFVGEATFGAETPVSTQTLVSGDYEDKFVAHYDGAGNFRWVKLPNETTDSIQTGVSNPDAPIQILPLRLVPHDAARAMILTGDFEEMLALDDITLTASRGRHAFVAVLPTVPTINSGDLIISEFRLDGPNGAADEFVEFYNNTNADIRVESIDSTTGWALVSSDAPTTPKFVIPNGAVIPARGHYLATGSAFSLGTYPAGTTTVGTGDLPYAADIPLNSGLALFKGTNVAAFILANRLDAVGPSALAADSLFKEGSGHPTLSAPNGSYSLFRNLRSGRPQDSNNNYAFASDTNNPNPQSDFVYASPNNTDLGMGLRLGTPGPESTQSPVERNAAIKASLIDPAQPSTAPPNRVRSGQTQPNAAYGTLSIQRRFTNTTTEPVTRLRFRITRLTTAPFTNTGFADLRVLSSTGTVTNSQGQTLANVTGLTLESPQAFGGGWNSTLSVNLPGGSLESGATIDVQFLLGVEQPGNYSFFVNVEALPGLASTATEGAGVPVRKAAGTKGNRDRR